MVEPLARPGCLSSGGHDDGKRASFSSNAVKRVPVKLFPGQLFFNDL